MQIKPIDLEKLVSNLDGLPIMSKTVDRVIELIQSPDATANELASVIEADEEITQKLLALINSPFFGFSRDIVTVRQALVTFGFEAVKNIIIGLTVLHPRKVEGFPLDLDRYAEDAFTSAVAAKIIIRNLEPQLEVEAFITGLMMNVGQLLFALHFPTQYEKLLRESKNVDRSLNERERKVFLWDHSRAGAMLAQRWGFKEELVLAIFYHHTTSIPPNINSQQAIMISTAYLAHLMLEVFRSKSKKEPFDLCVREANKRFNFSEDTVHHLLENIGRESADIAGSFDFKCNLSTSYTELLKTLSLQLGEMNLTYEQMVRELRKSKAEAERLAHQLRIANEQLKKRADLDGLTGIFNHRYFQEHLAVEFMRARRYKSPLALIIIDVDFFKKVNDNYGHQVGDEVLRSIARILKKNTRISDIVARYGGEEFVLMLPETLLDQAYIVAEKIRAIIEREQMHIGQSNVNVTVSAGVSAMEPGQSYETAIELINVADKKLYRAKHSGRNLVVK